MINVSIVLYKTDKEELKQCLNSVLSSELVTKVYLVDNSPTKILQNMRNLDSRIEYIFNNKNIGFGKAHNIAMKKTLLENKTKYHLVLNPDVKFEGIILKSMVKFMEKHIDVGLIAPKTLYPNGNLQYNCKLLPTPLDLIGRRFLKKGFLKKFVESRDYVYELRFTNYDKIMEVPFLSGCFMLFRTHVLNKVGLFEEKFFMYLEDVDISRRILKVSKNIFFPEVEIIHKHEKGSYKNKKLLKYHMISAIKYFNKWGWFNDKEREIINKKTLKKLGY